MGPEQRHGDHLQSPKVDKPLSPDGAGLPRCDYPAWVGVRPNFKLFPVTGLPEPISGGARHKDKPPKKVDWNTMSELSQWTYRHMKELEEKLKANPHDRAMQRVYGGFIAGACYNFDHAGWPDEKTLPEDLKPKPED